MSNQKRVCLDPAHGGSDNGFVGKELKEKDLTLLLAEMVQNLLNADGRFEVLMTRNSDKRVQEDIGTALDMAERARIANGFSPDLFISIRFSAVGIPSVRGVTASVLKDSGVAYDFASHFVEMTSKYERVPNRGVVIEPNTYPILRDVNAPSAVIFPSYITNPQDEMSYKSIAQQIKMSQYVYKSICSALGLEEKPAFTSFVGTPLDKTSLLDRAWDTNLSNKVEEASAAVTERMKHVVEVAKHVVESAKSISEDVVSQSHEKDVKEVQESKGEVEKMEEDKLKQEVNSLDDGTLTFAENKAKREFAVPVPSNMKEALALMEVALAYIKQGGV